MNFLVYATGKIKEFAAILTSAGAGDSGKIPGLDAAGKLDVSFMPSGVGPQTQSIVSSENLSSGNFVNVWDNAGTLNVRKADATAAGKEANGFVLAGTTSPAAATVYFSGTNTGLTGLSLGLDYYLSATPGAAVSTPPSSTGNVVQPLGRSISTTSIPFRPTSSVEIL